MLKAPSRALAPEQAEARGLVAWPSSRRCDLFEATAISAWRSQLLSALARTDP